jgi:hypothetical protein
MAERECPLSGQPRCSLPRVLDWEYVLLREHVSTMTGTLRRRQNSAVSLFSPKSDRRIRTDNLLITAFAAMVVGLQTVGASQVSR